MRSLTNLQLLVLLSALYSIAALLFLYRRSLSFGRKKDFSSAKGKSKDGIIYAFGKGMTPWGKESAGKHLPTYLGGIIYHGALLSAILFIFWDMFRLLLPSVILTLLQILWIIGCAAGIILFIKRSVSSMLRRLSCPDDFFANLVADIFLALTILASINAGWITAWQIFTIILFIYIPFGKIRHCFFFFVTRIVFGVFFGRRGVFSRSSRESES
jgi:hypothetical protein